MRVFCQECGAANDGEPGTKVMCVRCTSIFEVPGHFTPPPDAPAAEAKPYHPTADASAPVAAQPPPQTVSTAQWSTPAGTFTPDGSAIAIPKVHPLAIISLVVGMVGSVCCLIGPVAALVTGGIGLSKINAQPNVYTGKGLAIAGMALGGIELAFSLVSFVLAIVGNH